MDKLAHESALVSKYSKKVLELESENAQLQRELERLRELNSQLEAQLELNSQNVRYLFLHGGVSH